MTTYVDLGAHIGLTVAARCERYQDDAVWAFEPNPRCIEHPRWPRLLEKYPQLELTWAAAWIYDGRMDFYGSPERPDSEWGTVLPGKRHAAIDYEHPVRVHCLDFSAWLAAECAAATHLVLKMDIEGAEYAVLERMIETGTLALVDELMIEFHAMKFEDPTLWQRHEALLPRLRTAPLELTIFPH